jgi:Amt family ammonium transporter
MKTPTAIAIASALLAAPALALANTSPATAPAASPGLSEYQFLLLGLSAALVFFMQAGFALLESGLSRAKNSVNVLMKNYLDMCFGAMIFWAVGYGLMFGANTSGWFGTSEFMFNPQRPADAMYFLYQVMFAATTATIVSGAIAERTHFSAYIIGSMVITGLIYPVYGAWAWSGWHGGQGWLASIGFIDFAGSTVVHSVGGWCALAALLIVRPRMGRYGRDGSVRQIPGHNMSSATLGAFILWLGWFGFNGGSVALASNGDGALLGKVLLNTHLGGAGGAMGAVLAAVAFRSKILLTVCLNGAVGGLVSVTAGCHLMNPGFALLTGVIAGFLVSVSEALLVTRKIDDVVGAVSVHLVGGIWGTLAVALFNAAAPFDIAQLKIQLLGIAAAGLWTFPAALLMYWVLDRTLGMRATALQEQRGLDFSEHAEIGYPEFQREVVHSGKSGGTDLA